MQIKLHCKRVGIGYGTQRDLTGMLSNSGNDDPYEVFLVDVNTVSFKQERDAILKDTSTSQYYPEDRMHDEINKRLGHGLDQAAQLREEMKNHNKKILTFYQHKYKGFERQALKSLLDCMFPLAYAGITDRSILHCFLEYA